MSLFNRTYTRYAPKIRVNLENGITTSFEDELKRHHEIKEKSIVISPVNLKRIRKKYPYGVIKEKKNLIKISLVYGDFVIPYICKIGNGKFNAVENDINKIEYLVEDHIDICKLEILYFTNGNAEVKVFENHKLIANIDLYICEGKLKIFFETSSKKQNVQKKLSIRYGREFEVVVQCIKDSVVENVKSFIVNKDEFIMIE
jgi:uncharacterized protein YuzB (UPF0349 family)